MEQALFHLVLDGRTVGPYDTRTIIGMRVKKALADGSLLIREDGLRLTVEELLRAPRPDFDPGRSGAHSVVKASYDAEIAAAGRNGPLPRYQGPVQVRVQVDVLRIAGQLRGGKEDRVKIPLADVVHLRARESAVDLWLRAAGGKLQPATLRMMSPLAAQDLAAWLPAATLPPPELVIARLPLPYGILVGVSGAVLAIVAFVVAIALKR